MITHKVCIHVQYLFGVVRNNTKYLELIKRRSKVQEKNMSKEDQKFKKRICQKKNKKSSKEYVKKRSKVQEKNMSCERALNFDQ